MFIKPVLELVAPHRCLLCARHGQLVCADCYPQLCWPKAAICVLCNRLSDGFRTCGACRQRSSLYRVRVAAHYEGAVKELIIRLKYHGVRAAAEPLGQLLAAGLAETPDYLSFVPASSVRQRRRGYHPAALVAREVARRHRLSCRPLLGRVGQSQQVGAPRAQRLEQLANTFYVRQPALVRGKRVLVIDDVVTTGATLSEAARALKAAGVRRVEALVVAKE